MSDDLRDFIKKVEQIGECRIVEGADWNEEIGDILQAAAATPGSPMMVFDAIHRAGDSVSTTNDGLACTFHGPEV